MATKVMKTAKNRLGLATYRMAVATRATVVAFVIPATPTADYSAHPCA